MHVSREPQGFSPGHRDDELRLALHVPSIQVAQASFNLDATIAAFEARLDPHPVDGDRAHVLELDGTPEADRHLDLVLLRQAGVCGGGIWLEIAVVEETHDVALLVWLHLNG